MVSPEIKHAFQGHQSVSHPWFRGQRRVPWDTIRRIGTLMMAPDYYSVAVPADAPVPEILAPLYSQPVIEVLLRIPIHTHFHRGRDRGLARMAFVGEAPEPILRRLWKDRAPGFHETDWFVGSLRTWGRVSCQSAQSIAIACGDHSHEAGRWAESSCCRQCFLSGVLYGCP